VAKLTPHKLSSRGRRDGRRQFDSRAAADLRPSADGSAVRTSLVAGQLQAASVPIAQAAAPRSQSAIAWAGTDRRRDRRTDRSIV